MARSLEGLGAWVDRHGWLCFALLTLIYLLAVSNYSLWKPLWHDELFTFDIARAPTLSDLFRQTRTLDLNPPLSYLLTRWSFQVLGVNSLQCRLPEIAGFVLALVGIFVFVRCRAGDAYALLAVAILISSDAALYAFQARPYGLMLGFTALALAAWQRSHGAQRAGTGGAAADLGLFAALAALLLTHVFGVFAWMCLLAGEAVFVAQHRQWSLRRGLAMLLPAAAISLYGPLIHSHSMSTFPPHFQATVTTLEAFYTTEFSLTLLTLLCAVVLGSLISRGTWAHGGSVLPLNRAECVVLTGLAAIPVILVAQLARSHGVFFERYGIAAHLAAAVLLSCFVYWIVDGRPTIAVIAACLLLLFSDRVLDGVRSVRHRMYLHAESQIPGSNIETKMQPGVPLVAASGLTFVEMNHWLPAPSLDHVYFLTDSAAAMQYAHATIFNGMAEEAQAFGFHGHVEPYAEFLHEHPRFYVLGTYAYPEDWLLRKLAADGLHLRMVGAVEAPYKDKELYEVTVPSEVR